MDLEKLEQLQERFLKGEKEPLNPETKEEPITDDLVEKQLEEFINPEPMHSELKGVRVIIDLPEAGGRPIFTFEEYTRPITSKEVKSIIRHLFKSYRALKSAQAREEKLALSTNPQPSEEVA